MYEDLAVAVVNDIREGTFAYLPFDRLSRSLGVCGKYVLWQATRSELTGARVPVTLAQLQLWLKALGPRTRCPRCRSDRFPHTNIMTVGEGGYVLPCVVQASS